MNQIAGPVKNSNPGSRRGPFSAVLDLFSSVWFGVFLLILIFIHSSIGSAVPPVRQHRLLEMTEFEWFHWWPFDVLIGLFSITLIVTTIRRIPLRLVNAGVWTIHAGILILVAGSIYYFGTKVEGDVPVFRRKVVIDVPGAKKAAELLVRPGSEVKAEGVGGSYRFRVAEARPDWPILSGDDAGKKAYSVSVEVTTPQQTFVRQLLAGYPQYTEDVIPGKGRAIKSTGNKLVDENIKLSLDYAPQEHFYVKDSAALYVRRAGENSWLERPIAGLPRYNDHVPGPGLAWNVGPQAGGYSDLEVPIPDGKQADALSDMDVRVTGYLRYAFEQSRWVDGGDEIYPVVGVSVHSASEAGDFELAALDSRTRSGLGGQVEFRWLEDAGQLEQLGNSPPAKLTVTVPDKNITVEVPRNEFPRSSAESSFRKIEGSEYEFRIVNTLDRLPLGDGRILAVAMVEIRTPQKAFTRMVADDASSTQDMAGEGSGGGHAFVAPDPGIVMTYSGFRPAVVLAGAPDVPELSVFFHSGDGKVQRSAAPIGQTVESDGGWHVKVNHYFVRAKPEARPFVVPPERRDRDAGQNYAMIHVVLSNGGWKQSLWLPYNAYAFEDSQYAYPGRFRMDARRVRLPGGQDVELMYSRERHPLPAPVALDDFTLLTHQGGLIGTNVNVRDYISQLCFAGTDGKWSARVPMSLNQPAQKDGWWFYQSMWDPPSQSSAGMNYTGLGVGNRNGVYLQLIGVVIAVAGMLFAFYVKPAIIRRRRLEVYAEVAAQHEHEVNGRPKSKGGREPGRPIEAGAEIGSNL